jgi:hypothetical protein
MPDIQPDFTAKTDRNPDIRFTRKWGVYRIASLQFKAYFKVYRFKRICLGFYY